MSTTYGTATIAFPGFMPIIVETIDGRITFGRVRGSWKRTHLPSRNEKCADGKKVRLSKKERSRLLTLSKKWSGRSIWKGDKRVYPFRTIHRELEW
jgi:hypothetical protein